MKITIQELKDRGLIKGMPETPFNDRTRELWWIIGWNDYLTEVLKAEVELPEVDVENIITEFWLKNGFGVEMVGYSNKLAQEIKDYIDKVNKGEEDGIHRNNESRAKS